MSAVDTFETHDLTDAVSPYSKERSNQISLAYCQAAAPLLARIYHLIRVEGLCLQHVRRSGESWMSLSTVPGRRFTVGFSASHEQRITFRYDPNQSIPVTSESNLDADALRHVPRRARKSQGYWFGKLVALLADMEVYWTEYSPEKTADCRMLGPLMLAIWDNLDRVQASGLLSTHLPPRDELGLEMTVCVPRLYVGIAGELQFDIENRHGMVGVLIRDHTVDESDPLSVRMGVPPTVPYRGHKEWRDSIERLLRHVCDTLALEVKTGQGATAP